MNLQKKSLGIGFLVGLFVLGTIWLIIGAQDTGQEFSSIPVQATTEHNDTAQNKQSEKRYACAGYKSTFLHEKINSLNGHKLEDVLVEAGDATDKATIFVNQEQGYLGLLTTASVGVGESDPYIYSNYEESSNHILAWSQSEMHIDSLLFDKETGAVIWSKTRDAGPVLGSTAESIYFLCVEVL